MNVLNLEETTNTPKVLLDPSNHKIEFEGDSRPEDVQQFFTPILDWLEDYENLVSSVGSDTTITCKFQFDYFNSSSAKYVMDIISQLGEIKDSNEKINLEINWHYDEMDEDMLDAGKEFEDMLEIKFNFVISE